MLFNLKAKRQTWILFSVCDININDGLFRLLNIIVSIPTYRRNDNKPKHGRPVYIHSNNGPQFSKTCKLNPAAAMC